MTSREWHEFGMRLYRSEQKWAESDLALAKSLSSRPINMTIKGKKYEMPSEPF